MRHRRARHSPPGLPPPERNSQGGLVRTEDTVRQATRDRRKAVYEEAVQIIEREYATELDLDALARQIATSRRQLQRVFAEVGETSFREHLAKVRMRHA